jgi:hypothetical protein
MYAEIQYWTVIGNELDELLKEVKSETATKVLELLKTIDEEEGVVIAKKFEEDRNRV